MTVFLILAMVITVALLNGYLTHRRTRTARAAEQAVQYVTPSTQSPPDIHVHPGHTWVRVHDGGLASIGVTGFASNFAGELSAIDFPREGRRLRQAERAVSLIAKNRRRLDLVMPVGGRVLAVNRRLLADPTLAQRCPYDEGWLLRVRPKRLASALRNLMPTQAAQSWLDASRTLVAQRVTASPGALANDGGELDTAFGADLPEPIWDEIRRELFPAPEAKERGRR